MVFGCHASDIHDALLCRHSPPFGYLNFTFSAKRLGCYLIIFYCFQSDPMAVVYTKSKDGALEELGRTEVVLNSLNPMWFTKLIINYQFEVVQTLV